MMRGAGLVLASFLSAWPAFAQSPREQSTIVVYDDGAQNYQAILKRFAALLDPRDRPRIVSGNERASVNPENATLVWFGDLAHDVTETEQLPEALRSVADDLGADMTDRSEGLAPTEGRVGKNCYARQVDRENGLPEIVVNFSGDDPQNSCKGDTISYLLGTHGRWIRNDGTGCLLRDCVLILK
jgi:hypothetical protein